MKVPTFIKVSVLLAILLLAVLLIKPITLVPSKNVVLLEDCVEKVFEGEFNDIVFELGDHDVCPFIYKSTKHSLTINDLNKKLIGEKVNIKIVKQKSLLKQPQARLPLEYIEIADTGEVIYDSIS